MIKHWIIYMYTFPNGKKYIGKTCRNLSKRQGKQFSGYKRCTLLWNAIQKYGYESILQEVVFEGYIDDKNACELEKYYIALHKTNINKYNNPSYGYNLTDGGDGVCSWKPSAKRYKELCLMMDKFHKDRIGTKFSDESKIKMSLAKKGIKRTPLSDEAKRKISIANSRESMTCETQIRRSESKMKKIVAVSTEDGTKIVFDNMEIANKMFHVSSSTVTRWCKHQRNPSVNYIFDYLSACND